jgi:hypothetical protein
MTLTYSRDFSWKKDPNVPDVKEKIKSKLPDFYYKFQ